MKKVFLKQNLPLRKMFYFKSILILKLYYFLCVTPTVKRLMLRYWIIPEGYEGEVSIWHMTKTATLLTHPGGVGTASDRSYELW